MQLIIWKFSIGENGMNNNEDNAMYYLRDEVGNAVVDIGEKNENIVVVSANVMSSSRVSDSVKKFPNRAFNVGIAEQDMISFAAGLAKEDLIPYAFTMAPFMSMRACEQVRTDVAYNNLNVRMFASYAGVSGGISGATHWGIEDCSIMTGIAGMVVLEPCDPVQAKKMVEESVSYEGPIYMRIGVEPVKKFYDSDYDYKIGKADYITKGNDGAFICSGVVVKYAVEAAKKIKENYKKDIMVVDMHTIKPIDREAVLEAAKTGNVIVAQDHNIIGGLGSMVAMVLAENRVGVNFKILGVPDKFVTMGHAPFLYHKYGYDSDGLYLEMEKMISK